MPANIGHLCNKLDVLKSSPEKSEMAASAHVSPVAQRALNILLVEDNADNRLLLLCYMK